MKKWIGRIFILISLFIVFCFCWVFYTGKKEYNRMTSSVTLTELVEEARLSSDYVEYDEISPDLIHATVSIEDKRFYSHHGVDYTGLVRGLLSQFFSFLARSGGSTITQQVVKNLYGQFNPTIEYKCAELFFATELEREYSKDEIIALYVNIINYGDNCLGISQASHHYFNMDPAELDIARSSLLAGIPQSPANYQLSNHYEEAKTRQRAVLEAMASSKYIEKSQIEEIWQQEVY